MVGGGWGLVAPGRGLWRAGSSVPGVGAGCWVPGLRGELPVSSRALRADGSGSSFGESRFLMTVTGTAAAADADTLCELGRFLVVFGGRVLRGRRGPVPMFSGRIDAAWHRLAGDPDAHAAFARRHAGVPVAHRPGAGAGPVGWIEDYEAAYGPLPAVWFTDEAGRLDEAAYAAYRSGAGVRASWNCAPSGGDGDDDVAPGPGPAPRR